MNYTEHTTEQLREARKATLKVARRKRQTQEVIRAGYEYTRIQAEMDKRGLR